MSSPPVLPSNVQLECFAKAVRKMVPQVCYPNHSLRISFSLLSFHLCRSCIRSYVHNYPIYHGISVLHSTFKFSYADLQYWIVSSSLLYCVMHFLVDFAIHYWKVGYCGTIKYHCYDYCLSKYCDSEKITIPRP